MGPLTENFRAVFVIVVAIFLNTQERSSGMNPQRKIQGYSISLGIPRQGASRTKLKDENMKLGNIA